MNKAATLRSVQDGTTVTFRDAARSRYEPGVGKFVVHVRGPAIEASATVDGYMSEGLPRLFREMARSWTGWKGAKEWQSLEGELKLSAESDSLGHVTLRVSLRSGHYAYGWRIEIGLLLEAGQLEDTAHAIESWYAQYR